MALKELLVFVEYMARRRQRSEWRVYGPAPGVSVGSDKAQIPDVIPRSYGRKVFEPGIDVAPPQIGWFKNMHVAVQNFKTVFHARLRFATMDIEPSSACAKFADEPGRRVARLVSPD
jgi:hypothetical protein